VSKALAWQALLVVGLFQSPALAGDWLGRDSLEACNRRLCGQVVDFTHNHGADRRIWSPALGQPRDLYVYLPPRFDPNQPYPAVLFLHGFLQDETAFVQYVVEDLDRAIVTGRLPPVIVAAPDGSLNGRASYFSPGSFFINSKAGRFEDYVIQDVWGFVTAHYPIRPEREAHVLAGASMGGFGAYNLAMKHPDLFKVVVGIFPPLNLRWVDCHGRYMANFDPCCWGWRNQVDRGHEVIGRFYLGVVTIRLKKVIDPLFGRGPEALAAVSHENPIEMLDHLDIPNGLLDTFVGYGGKDEFNLDAQIESFLYRARQRGLCVTVAYDPKGRHNPSTARKLFDPMVAWLAPRLAPYSPPLAPGECRADGRTATLPDCHIATYEGAPGRGTVTSEKLLNCQGLVPMTPDCHFATLPLFSPGLPGRSFRFTLQSDLASER
jgi:S-formylglutathione hydrolase FrmB